MPDDLTRAAEDMAKQRSGHRPPAPPALDQLPLINASQEVAHWFAHYWRKLRIDPGAAARVAVTSDRQEFALWTGRRLNPMALGCYCYLPNAGGDSADIGCGEEPELLNAESATRSAPSGAVHLQPALPGFDDAADDDLLTGDPDATSEEDNHLPGGDHRHLIFIEPDLLPMSTEVTVAHELIHLFDRVQGHPRKHRCHGYDAISVDEAALTERDPEYLRAQLREETVRRELAMRRVRPYRYIYVCPACQREYPRVRRYSRPVSCGRCDRHYNLSFMLRLREIAVNTELDGASPADDDAVDSYDAGDALPTLPPDQSHKR